MRYPNLGRAIYCSLLLSASLLATSFPSSIAYDRPIPAVVLLLLVTGLTLITLARIIPSVFGSTASCEEKSRPEEWYLSLLVDQVPKSHEVGAQLRLLQNYKARRLLIGAVAALSFRIELLRRILNAAECTFNSVEVFTPGFLSVYDAFRCQNSRSTVEENPIEHDTYETIFDTIRRCYSNSRFTSILPAFAISYGCYLASELWTGATPTYICPLVAGQNQNVPLMQYIAVILDCFILIAQYEICFQHPPQTKRSREKLPVVWGSILLIPSTFWAAVGVVVFISKPEYRNWLVPLELIFDPYHFYALLWQSFLLTTILLCSAYCIMLLGLLEVALTLTMTCTMIPMIFFLWSHRHPFPPISVTASVWSVVLILGGYLSFQHAKQHVTTARFLKNSTYLVLFLALTSVLYPVLSKPSFTHFHPIDLLIYGAKAQHQSFALDATKSADLEEAVAEYRERYQMRPPPGFDKWYSYARLRKAAVIDRYDQIYNDILPFWSVPPDQLRQNTWDLVSNPWNAVGGISVRAGHASVVDGVPATHRWVLDGAETMINKFANDLPDMDLAFNLNEEARVSVPYTSIEDSWQSVASAGNRSRRQSWSADRTTEWVGMRKEPYNKSALKDSSSGNKFLEYGSTSCNPSSPARCNRDLYSHSHLCVSCAGPHSLGQFLSNWALSADMCHQPDMAQLHGFYISPSAFRGTHALVPLFSQSKPHGFKDILYPSPWNYMDKAAYAPTDLTGHSDPPFEEKRNVLFWRGSTSEGAWVREQSWRGMAHHRLVHLANNLTSSVHDTVTILLPTTSTGKERPQRYQYINIPGAAVKDHLGLTTDIAIANSINHCGDRDPSSDHCHTQRSELGLITNSTNLQSHWQYRYLFDLDDADADADIDTSSSRHHFYAFLQSHSLPFRAALFREWYDERLTAWYHFVPQDLRLHAVWSTLAYFAGVNGTVPHRGVFGPRSRRVEMAPHILEGERIAEQGREWANEVLRKVDMEIYMFRLLLEWGRVTDDNRHDLGFVYQPKPGRP